MIALLHSNYIEKSSDIGWYIAVDYFFIISGFMLVNSFARKKQSTGKYIMGRIGKLWPHQLFAFGAFLIYYLCRGSIGSIPACVDVTCKHLSEVVPFGYFMFDPEFAGGYAYNFPVWYLSVLLVCSLIIYFLLDKCEAALKYVITPVGVLLLSVGVLCSFLYSPEHKISARINTAVLVRWLSELMYPVFLNHILVIQVLEWCGIKGKTGINVIIYIISLFCYSTITKLCVDKSVSLVKKLTGHMVKRRTESIK